MSDSDVLDKVIEEIKHIPEYKLPEVYAFVHSVRVGMEQADSEVVRIMRFAGCWQDVSEDVFKDFLGEVRRRRGRAFRGRRGNETGLD